MRVRWADSKRCSAAGCGHLGLVQPVRSSPLIRPPPLSMAGVSREQTPGLRSLRQSRACVGAGLLAIYVPYRLYSRYRWSRTVWQGLQGDIIEEASKPPPLANASMAGPNSSVGPNLVWSPDRNSASRKPPFAAHAAANPRQIVDGKSPLGISPAGHHPFASIHGARVLVVRGSPLHRPNVSCLSPITQPLVPINPNLSDAQWCPRYY